MPVDDVLSYLNSLRKPDTSDPLCKWIGTNNLKRIMLKIFKWLYYANNSLKGSH